MKVNGPLQIIPDCIFLHEFSAGDQDSAEVYVKNIGKSSERIRFSIPPNTPFFISNAGTITLPPGLETKIEIKYTGTKDENQETQSTSDSQAIKQYKIDLKCQCPSASITIPVIASPPAARLMVDHQNIQLGNVCINSGFKFSFIITNLGVLEGNFSLSADKGFNSIEIVPQHGTIEPSKNQEISCIINPTKEGDLKFNIKIESQDSLEIPQPITVTAKVVQDSICIEYNNQVISEIDFRTLYIGQKRLIKTILRNKGSHRRSFAIIPPQDTPIGALQSGKSNLLLPTFRNINDDSHPIFGVTPSEGILNPHEAVTINFIFTPPNDNQPIDDLENSYNQFTSILIVETGQKIDLQLSGKGVRHIISFSMVDFVFGKVNIGAKVTQSLTISNESHYLPTTFSIKPLAQYGFEPSEGLIESGQSKKVSITFHPRNYGIFNTQTLVTFSDKLFSKNINLFAQCGQISTQPFKRSPIWEKSEAAMYAVHHPGKLGLGLDEIKKRNKLRSTFDGYITESAAKRKIRSAMVSLRQTAKSNAISCLKHTLGDDYTQDELNEQIDLELATLKAKKEDTQTIKKGEGLKPPNPEIDRRPAPLQVANPERFGVFNGSSSMSKSRRLNDGNFSLNEKSATLKKKFQAKPTTPQQIKECNATLTPAQQLQIFASHQTVDFGKISVFSTATKTFTLTNDLQQSVLATINYDYEELSSSSPESQVIGPSQTAGFEFKFKSEKPLTFAKPIQYTINGQHTFPVNIAAQVIPIDVQLSRSSLEFRFSHDSDTPIVKETVTLINKSNGQAQFNFTDMNNVFSLNVVTGTIKALKTTNVEITYKPTNHPHDELTLVLNIVGGPSRSLKLIGDCGSPKCSLSKRSISFGLIPIGLTKSQQLKISNTSEDDAIYTVSHSDLSELTISPMNGMIRSKESQSFQLTFKSTRPYSFNIPVTVAIAGANPLVFHVSGQSELPQVQINRNEFEFGKLFVGSTKVIDATLTNVGQIPAILFLDLSQHHEFHIEYNSELNDCVDNEKVNSILITTDPVFVTKSETGRTSSAAESSRSVASDDSNSKENGLIYRIYIVEGSSVSFNLVFQPTEANDHSFELPLTMMNNLHDSSFNLQPIVSADVVRAPLSLSSTSINFGVSPVYDESNPHSRSVVNQLVLTNEFGDSLDWRIGSEDDLNGNLGVFSIEPCKGTIENSRNQKVNVLFHPKEAVPYNVLLPVYVKTSKEQQLIGKVQLVGVGSNSLLTMSSYSVTLPTVPLNVKSEVTVYVLNCAFVEAKLDVQLSVDEKSFPIQVSFPEGNVIQHTTAKLPVLLTFKSSKPLSFSTLVALVDENGQAVTFSVSCTSDNSIFSLYPLLNTTEINLKSNPGKPILIELPTVNKVTEITARFNSVSDFIELKGEPLLQTVQKKDIEFIVRYLNATVMSTQIIEFPNDLIKDDFALFLELISNLMNGRKLQLESDRNDSLIKDPALKRREVMNRLLKGLQSVGCLLSSIKPEFLLSLSDFLSIMKGRITKQFLGIDQFNSPEITSFDQQEVAAFVSSKGFTDALVQRMKVLEGVYANLSNEAWLFVIMQAVKVFIIGRITYGRLSETPGVSDTIKQLKQITSKFSTGDELLSAVNRSSKSISSSNIYSVGEGVLLNWISLNNCKFSEDLEKSVINFADLSDSVAFMSLFRNNTTVFNSSLNSLPNEINQKESNAIEIINAMKSLKLGFIPKANEIVKGSLVSLCLISAYLFETLPNFLPKATVEFSTSLHKTVKKTVNITNPSKTEITYNASIKGNPNYAIENESVTIQANGEVDFPISFTARSLKTVTGRLTLIPSRPRLVSKTEGNSDEKCQLPLFYSPVVIDLTSNVTLTSPDLSFNIEGMIYQPTKLSIPLKNFIGVPCSARLKTKIIRLIDENGKQIKQELSFPQEVSNMISQQHEHQESANQEGLFNSFIEKHKMFIFSMNEIDFADSNSEVTIEVEFVPLQLGTFRCIALFSDDKKGEFVIEIVAKSTLPQPIEFAAGKFKIEVDKKLTNVVPVDLLNMNLVRALAYSIEKSSNINSTVTERRFKDLLFRKEKEIELVYKQSFTTKNFTLINSSTQFFETPKELSLFKPALNDTLSKSSKMNSIQITFKPSKPGNYPLRILLISDNDVRLFNIKAIGIEATKEISLDFQTVVGRIVQQDIPLNNPSNNQWTYKISIQGDKAFSVPQRISIKPHEKAVVPVTLKPLKMGTFSASLTIFNLVNESTLVYKLSANVDEPPAEEKIIIKCNARKTSNQSIKVKSSIIKNGKVQVSSTIPIISFGSDYEFVDGELNPEFCYSIYAPRSGLAVGTITFSDPLTNNKLWYILEIHVDSPAPEETINVNTVARKSVILNIPIENPKNQAAKFSVILSDDDMIGEKCFIAEPNKSTNYTVEISPLKEVKRMSSVYFYSDEDGEFWYSLKIEASKPPDNIIAPLTSPIGKYASTFVTLTNPTDKIVSFRAENDNMASFQVISKKIIQLNPHAKKKVEIRYIPSSIGKKEAASICFKSNEVGDWIYKLTGTGKPPQPLSPIILNSSINSTSSAFILFNNPFQSPSKFLVSLSTSLESKTNEPSDDNYNDDENEIFKILIKKKIFTLSKFGEEFQVPFVFSPTKAGKFEAHIVIAALGSARNPAPDSQTVPDLTWVYPIIGNSLTNDTPKVRSIRTKAHLPISEKMNFPLPGESESFDSSEYKMELLIPPSYDFVRNCIDFRAISINRYENSIDLNVEVKFSPLRPFSVLGTLSVKNPLGQEWQFQLDLKVECGKPNGMIVVESLLNKQGAAKCIIDSTFPSQTPFHAYFVHGSAAEFHVEPEHGLIHQSLGNSTELPITIFFEPKMYGKLLKGLLVIDTLDAQYLFEVFGKTPDYVPPIAQPDSTRLGTHLTDEEYNVIQPFVKKKRNVIKDNIEGAKIAKPRVNTSHVNFR